jgi:Tol biopolymer transport system component
MTVTSGTRIGPFEVLELLGAGAMGAVYRAHDPRLRREVAVKVLPSAFSRDSDRLRRFEQEALAIARLAHPHIVAIHDVGTHDDSPYIVMELLSGETLRSRLQGRALPARKVVQYATQIARGLAAAHEQGIIHRDIKPDNLFVTRDAQVKILDFGIAKLKDVGGPTGTAAETLTVVGFVGTPSYSSPEQASGREVDHRTDLFSLGIVLYEMLTGVSPFRRDTAAESMTAVLHEDPPAFAAALNTPPALVRVVQHCLEKNPADRYQNARDLAFDLDGLSPDAAGQAVEAGRRAGRGLALAGVALLGLMLVAAFAIGRRSVSIPAGRGPAEVHRLTDFSGLEEFPTLAPDGKSLAFTARVDGYRQIFVRLLAGGTPLQITRDAADHELPRWSPDASSIVYFAPASPGDLQGTLWDVPALGGASRRIMDSVGGGDVSANGRLACFRLVDRRIELVTASMDGSDVKQVARFDDPVYFKYPRWSPDAKSIAFQRGDGFRWDIFSVPADGGSPRQLTADNRQLHGLTWLPDGSGIVYSSSRATTMAYLPPISLWEAHLDGAAPSRIVPVDLSYLHPDAHRSGALVASRLRLDSDLWRYPIDGSPTENVQRAERLTHQTGQVQTPTTGRSDGEIAFLSDSGGHANLWVTTPTTGELRQITHERDPTVTLGLPLWSPDGEWIAFVSSRGHTGLGFGLWLVGPDGGNLRNIAPSGLGAAWSSDGQSLYYADAGALYKVAAKGGAAVAVRPGPVRNVIGVAGSTLYFTVDRTLTDGTAGFEIHAASPENAPSRVLATISARRVPQWQIINPALSPDGHLLAMPLTDGVTTNIWTLSTTSGEWRQITDFGDRPTFIARRVSWSADGRSLLAAVSEGDADIVLLEAPGPAR